MENNRRRLRYESYLERLDALVRAHRVKSPSERTVAIVHYAAPRDLTNAVSVRRQYARRIITARQINRGRRIGHVIHRNMRVADTLNRKQRNAVDRRVLQQAVGRSP